MRAGSFVTAGGQWSPGSFHYSTAQTTEANGDRAWAGHAGQIPSVNAMLVKETLKAARHRYRDGSAYGHPGSQRCSRTARVGDKPAHLGL